ncbi:radical SAM protein [Candidatus Woesearchaeota archaeon]|nr:radical SAM protein [Candidatus Woesearchaeota archaeon]
MAAIEKTGHHSWKLGPLCEGCERCVRGEKLVVFVTGVCPARCFYCPISKEKKQSDIIYVNERNVKEDTAVIEEAKASQATGAGFTGGDPLARLDRTIRYMKLLKKEFGKDFHIHLYTPFDLVTEERLQKLYDAGLDEIRFHPKLDDDAWWDRINLVRKFDLTIGVEIPVLPDKVEETKKLLEYIDGKIDFLNLNELEISELNEEFFHKIGYYTKNMESYGVEGSDEAAMQLMEFVKEQSLSYPVHYCTCTLKDLVQMGNRLKRRAENTKLPFDDVDEDGLVTRGAIYNSLLPTVGYEKHIEHLGDEERQQELKELELILKELKKEYGLGDEEYFLDLHKPRILVSAEWLVEHAAEIEQPCAVVTEYPTWDSFPIEIDFLNGILK